MRYRDFDAEAAVALRDRRMKSRCASGRCSPEDMEHWVYCEHAYCNRVGECIPVSSAAEGVEVQWRRAKTDEPNPKDLLGVKKVPTLSVIPSTALVHMGLAMQNGAEKYGPFNWREHPVQSGIYVDAAMRHLSAWVDGEEDADDSGVHHLGHAMACLGILLDAQEVGNLIDQRVPGPAAKLLAHFAK